MAVYVIIEIKIKDRQVYSKYIARVRAIVEKYKGRYVVRGGKITPLFNSWHPERIIVIEFSSRYDVDRWLSSAEYKAIAILREESTETKAIVVEGCDA